MVTARALLRVGVSVFQISAIMLSNGFQQPFPQNMRTSKSTPLHVEPALLAGGAAVVLSGGAAALWWSGGEEREKRAKYAEWEEKDAVFQAERARLAYIQPRTSWSEAELKEFDGTRDEDGPLLFAADGLVFNVWKGRRFYGPGCEYQIFAGRDATRLLAKFIVEEEDKEAAKRPLSVGERVTLAGYVYTFKQKYDVVGALEGYDPKDTSFT